MTTNLYDLPKDKLIKLIGTIQEDSNKQILELERKLEETNELLDAYEDMAGGKYDVCKHQDCKAKLIYGQDMQPYETRTRYINCHDLFRCKFFSGETGSCSNYYCDEHVSLYTKKMIIHHTYSKSVGIVCNSCEPKALKNGSTFV